MDITFPIIKIAFFALPGLTASKVYRKLRGPSDKKPWEDFVELLFFTVTTYLLYAALLTLWCHATLSPPNPASQSPPLVPQESLLCEVAPATPPTKPAPPDPIAIPELSIPWLQWSNQPLRWQDPLFASILGIIVGFVASYFQRYKVINRLGRLLRATNRYGDEDVWEYFHNSPQTPEWLIVRDHKTDLVYFGAIHVFSDTGKERELLMEDVDVFSNQEPVTKLYSVSSMYLCRAPHDLTIENWPVPKDASQQLGGLSNGRTNAPQANSAEDH